MAFDSAESGAGSGQQLHPMQIAQNTLFTAKEKLDLLHRIKAEVSGSMANSDDLGFSAEEVDDAIHAVKLGAQTGEQTKTVIWGDN